MDKFDAIIIGQGFAGLSAARLAAQRGLRTANFEGEMTGGLIINVNELDPLPAGAEHSGAELASNIAMLNLDNGVESVSDAVVGMVCEGSGWSVKTANGTYGARHVVVASGARLRKLNVPGEENFFGQGVSVCADCDGPLFSDQETVVVGGGDSAYQEAVTLAQYARKVTLLLRSDVPRARPELVARAVENPRISLLTGTRVLEVVGEPGKGVDGVRIASNGHGEQTLTCTGVFVFIGLEPNTAFLPAEVQRDPSGALVVSPQCATNLPGLWAIGAVRAGFGGLLTDAAADAERVIAALS
jgi:thioredoxin reductase (NADPH)